MIHPSVAEEVGGVMGMGNQFPPPRPPESLALSSFLSCPFLVVWCGLDGFFFSRRRGEGGGVFSARERNAATVHSELNQIESTGCWKLILLVFFGGGVE